MTKPTEVSLQDWSKLYEAAMAFKQLQPWKWMFDGDLFGVQHPETGEIGYCCVMGALGEVFALSVYTGSAGLDSYWHLHEQASLADMGVSIHGHELLVSQLCLMASFEDRAELHKDDLKIIKALGLKFRGKQAWPMFRSYRPGFVPWFVTPAEVQFLTLALHQAIEVASQCIDNPDLLQSPDENKEQYYVRVFQKGEWQWTWQEPAALEEMPMTPVLNEMLLAQLKQAQLPQQGIWETDCLLLPMAVREGERPFYPYGLPIMNRDGFALGMELFHPDNVEQEMPNKFMETLQKVQYLPQVLLVGSEKTLDLLGPIAQKLNFSIELAEDLPALDNFFETMGQSFFGPP